MVWIVKGCFEGTVQLYTVVLKTKAILPRLKCFFHLNLETDIQNGALIYPLECCSPYNPESTHITAVTRINSLRVINIKNICRNCIYITIAENAAEHNNV